MDWNRRNFLKVTSAALLATYSRSIFALTKIIEEAPGNYPAVGLVLLPVKNALHLLDTEQKRVKTITIPNQSPHCVISDPHLDTIVYVIDQEDPLVSVVDIKKEEVIQTIAPSKGYLFAGHGALTRKNNFLYLAEFPANLQSRGLVTVYETKNFQRIRSFPSGGIRAHNIAFQDEEKTLVVGHQGTLGPPPYRGGNISFLRASDGKILSTYQPEDNHWFMSHFEVAEDGTIYVSSQNYNDKVVPPTALVTPLLRGKMGQKKWEKFWPDSIRAKMLQNHTIFFDAKKSRLLMAHTQSNLVSIWDTKTMELVHRLELENDLPLGIDRSVHGDFYVINTKQSKIHFVSSKDFTTVAETKFNRSFGARHISVRPWFS